MSDLEFGTADVRDLETVEILGDPAFVRDIEKGLAEADRGDLLSFEDVFGEPPVNVGSGNV